MNAVLCALGKLGISGREMRAAGGTALRVRSDVTEAFAGAIGAARSGGGVAGAPAWRGAGLIGRGRGRA